jgi:hypothetical protein
MRWAAAAAALASALCVACGGEPSPAGAAQAPASGEGARPATEAAERGALERLWETAGGAREAASEATDSARARIEELYRQAREAGENVPQDVMGWTLQDIARIGTWEYRIERIPGEPGEVQAALNALGAERWEAYWVERDSAGLTVHLKRRTRSYLERVPIGDLLRLVPRGEGP